MSDARRRLGRRLAKGRTVPVRTLPAQVVDVTDKGVNLKIGSMVALDVPCPDSYLDRRPGDWVEIRITGTRPKVIGRQSAAGAGQIITDLATQAAAATAPVASVAWSASTPGAGWFEASQVWVRPRSDGRVDVHYVLTGAGSSPASAAPDATVAAAETGLWTNGSGFQPNAAPRQGSDDSGDYTGAWYFGTALDTAVPAATLTAMTLRITRLRGIGPQRVTPLLYLHNDTAPPASTAPPTLGQGMEGPPMTPGAIRDIVLPPEWASDLADGAARGLAVAGGGPDALAAFALEATVTIRFNA
jgi:hypothetical protein